MYIVYTVLFDVDAVIKAQVLSSGRFSGVFSPNGFQGGIHQVQSSQEAKEVATQMLHHKLITEQAPNGIICEHVYIAESLKNSQLKRELYIGLVMDRNKQELFLIGSPFGGSRTTGSSISDIALSHPHFIFTEQIDIEEGLQWEQCERMVENICPDLDANSSSTSTPTSFQKIVEMIYNLYHNVFIPYDCTQLEINPLVETYEEGRIIARDVNINFDDNAIKVRHADTLGRMRDDQQEDPREVEARKHHINYIGLNGNIGCMVNGAGLAMATMDLVVAKGGAPSNFLDVGGGASLTQISKAFAILESDPTCRVILINIFGGLMRCDVMVNGILLAAKALGGIHTPIVIRLQGTNYEEGKQLIDNYNNSSSSNKSSSSGNNDDHNNNGYINMILATDLDDAVTKAVLVASELSSSISTKTTTTTTTTLEGQHHHRSPQFLSSLQTTMSTSLVSADNNIEDDDDDVVVINNNNNTSTINHHNDTDVNNNNNNNKRATIPKFEGFSI